MSIAPDDNGLRTRVGIVSPDDGINDDEFWRYAPDDVTLLWTRYTTASRSEPISVDMVGTYGQVDLVRAAAQTLAMTRPQAVGFSCNSCSFVHGPETDAAIRAALSDACKCPATSVTHAQVEALRRLGATRIALGAPYDAAVTGKLVTYLNHFGIDAVSVESFGLKSEWQIGNTPATRWYDLARRIDRPQAQAVVLACSGIRTFDVHVRIERDLGKPLVAAPAVLVWHCLRLAGVGTPIPRGGILLEKH